VAFRVAGATVAEAAFDPEGKQPIVIEGRRRQVGEHAPVTSSGSDRRIDGAAGRQAEISRRMGCPQSDGGWHHV
jgi:hypothetical protein